MFRFAHAPAHPHTYGNITKTLPTLPKAQKSALFPFRNHSGTLPIGRIANPPSRRHVVVIVVIVVTGHGIALA